MGFGNSNGDGVSTSGKLIIGGILFFAALVIVPSALGSITGINFGMEPLRYKDQIVKNADGVSCTAFNPDTQAQQLKECRTVATLGLSGATMFKQLIDAIIVILGILGVVLIVAGVLLRVRG